MYTQQRMNVRVYLHSVFQMEYIVLSYQHALIIRLRLPVLRISKEIIVIGMMTHV
jgi:hypothetical protein